MAMNELITNLSNGDNVNANKEFNSLMADKMAAALDAKKIEVASGMIQRNTAEKKQRYNNPCYHLLSSEKKLNLQVARRL